MRIRLTLRIGLSVTRERDDAQVAEDEVREHAGASVERRPEVDLAPRPIGFSVIDTEE